MRFKDIKVVIEYLKQLIPIKDLVEDDVGMKLQRSGKHWIMSCPFHAETNPSFRVSDPSSPIQRFRCYGASCEKNGDIITWICLRNGTDVPEAIKHLADKYEIDITQYMDQEDPQFLRYLEVMDIFFNFVTNDQNKQVAYSIMANRDISTDAVDKFRVGWSPSLKETVNHLTEHGVSFEELRILELDNENLVDQTLVIPHTDTYGRYVGMKCRRNEEDGPKYYGLSKNHPLYPEKLLFGLSIAKRYIYLFGGTLNTVEGDIDVIHMHDAEYSNTVGGGGSIANLTEKQIAQLDSIIVDEIVSIPDGDAAGIESALKLAKNYKTISKNRLHRIAKVDSNLGEDPDEIIKNHGIDPISDMIVNAVHPIQYYVDHIKNSYDVSSITGVYQFLNAIANAFKDLTTIDLDVLAKYVAAFVGLDQKHIVDYIKQLTVDVNLYEYTAEETFLASVFSTTNRNWMLAMSELSPDDFSVFNRDLADQVFIFYEENRTKDADMTMDRFVYYLSINGLGNLIQKLETLTPKMNDLSLVVDLIKDRSTRRKIRQSCEATRIKLYDLSTDVDVIATQFKLGLNPRSINLFEKATPSVIAKSYWDILRERLESTSTIVGVPLSPRWTRLNNLWSGMQLGETVLVTAPTGHGKSAAALEWAIWMAINTRGPKVPILYINAEMREDVLVSRIMSIMTGIGNTRIQTGDLDKQQSQRVADAIAIYSKSCFYLETPRNNTLSEWMGAIEFHLDKHGTRYIFCDYIQRLKQETNNVRWQEYSDVSVELQNRCIRPGDELGMVLIAQQNEAGRQDRFGGVNFTSGSKNFGKDATKCLSIRKLAREQIAQQGINNGNMQYYIDKDRSGRDDIVLQGFYSKHLEGNLRIGEVESMGEDEFWPQSELALGGQDHEGR